MAGEDFVNVQLSAAGVKFAGEAGVVRIVCRRDFTFKAGEPQAVLRAYEWSHILSPMLVGEEAMFELAPASSTTAPEANASASHEGQAL